MEKLLIKHGFVKNENEWKRDNWTVRFFVDGLEAFNEARINTPGKYFKCDPTLENLKNILEDIDSF